MNQPATADSAHNKALLRRQLRQQRQSLSQAQQKQASRRLLLILKRHPLYRNSRHIALYLANDGELDVRRLTHRSLLKGKHFYLPIIRRDKHLDFAPIRPRTPLIKNRFGIPEPMSKRGLTAANALDLVLIPLVGFDRSGGRLGMGGGYYDRTFAFRRSTHWRSSTPPPRPKARTLLVGVAHAFQEVDSLPSEHWDIGLDAVVTDQGWWLFDNGLKGLTAKSP